ncbi:hypothetical protein WJX84_008748 [Apatococcus fuscideae]|uniref:Presenilin n=1 Tax=Apatococcus fuscideae TaxID=2026836 RepID=A0AAW1TBF5_9CHLO
MEVSVLDELGQEITGIVAPVTICMALTVLLVKALNPDGSDTSVSVYFAQAFYAEKEGDSTATKLEGSLINALIFVAAITAVTFILVLLFKYGYTNIIYGYMGFAGFSIFFILTGVIALRLMEKAGIAMDAFSFLFILWNFAVVGVATAFYVPAPILLKQGYMIVVGVITAFLFTSIPEWTTWMLLLAMSAYDLYAVLTPVGPLKLLVDLAIERDADLPALIYESRPTGRGRQSRARQQQRQDQLQQEDDTAAEGQGEQPLDLEPGHTPSNLPITAGVRGEAAADAAADADEDAPLLPAEHRQAGESGPSSQPRMYTIRRGSAPAGTSSANHDLPGAAVSSGPQGSGIEPAEEAAEEGDSSPDASGSPAQASSSAPGPSRRPRQQRNRSTQSPEMTSGTRWRQPQPSTAGSQEEPGLEFNDSIKLGLGDFIFYSVLVGRAAMYDMLTVFASYLGIVAGVVSTLLLLALFRKALPALPISIFLGVIFYFVARLVLEPVVLPMTLSLVYF